MNLAEKLIESHLHGPRPEPGEEIALRVDQTLTQDATGTLVMLEFEAFGLDRVRSELSAQYVDHNLLQTDYKNADDHVFLRSACEKFGVIFSPPGNGVSHPVHMEHFGIPGKTLLGSDSHTCAAGSLGMLAMGAGGLEVAMAMAGEPVHLAMPAIWGIELRGRLPEWVSAKDVILELLRRHGVKGGLGCILEFHGPGVRTLDAMDRHVIANMGAELGATATVFPSDERVREFLEREGRGGDWVELSGDPKAGYDRKEAMDLGALEPLIARPGSPGNVVPVREAAGLEIYQSYVGSSANPGFRDFAVCAEIAGAKGVHPGVSLDINPTSRRVLLKLERSGHLAKLLAAGARLHQAGCNGCIGMGQAPATGHISLRTVPRNFPGRSGTVEDQVYLCSPETAAASAVTGRITDPRDLGGNAPAVTEPLLESPGHFFIMPSTRQRQVELEKGPNILPLPEFPPLGDALAGPVMLSVGDNVSTDEILPAGSRVLPFRSNIPEISKFVFTDVDPSFYSRSREAGEGGFFITAGENYGQGSSREHAALAPRYLGLRAVLALSFARIHWQNLVQHGVLPLVFENPADRKALAPPQKIAFRGLRSALRDSNRRLMAEISQSNRTVAFRHRLSRRQVDVLLQGGLVNAVRNKTTRSRTAGA